MNTVHLGVIVHVCHYTYTELTSSQNVSMLCKVHEAMQTQSTLTGQAFTLCSCSFLCEWYNFSVLQQRRHPLQSLAFPCIFPACSNPSPPSPKAENLVYLVHYKFS